MMNSVTPSAARRPIIAGWKSLLKQSPRQGEQRLHITRTMATEATTTTTTAASQATPPPTAALRAKNKPAKFRAFAPTAHAFTPAHLSERPS